MEWDMIFGRCLSHEGGALLSRSSDSLRGFRESLGRVRTRARLLAMLQKSAVTRRQPHWHLDLELPSLSNCEKCISVVYKMLRLRYFVIATSTQQMLFSQPLFFVFSCVLDKECGKKVRRSATQNLSQSPDCQPPALLEDVSGLFHRLSVAQRSLT